MKDNNYLIKLTRYSPTVKSKVVENASRKTCIVNEETVNERFEDHYLDYLKFVKDLPQYSCISCESLIKPSDSKIISHRMKKLNNDTFVELKQYLCSEKRESIGKERVDSVLNRYLCNYCNNKLNKNEIPRTSVINGYDAGKCPQEISKVNIFHCSL